MKTKKAKIGDICEIQTPGGLAYVQYTHDSASMGQLVRVLPGLFETRPADFASLAKLRELYFVFYTLNYALRAGQCEVVSHQPVPEWARPYPLLRWPGARDQTGKVLAWKIIRASDRLTPEFHFRTPVVRALTPEQEKLSIDVLRPHPVMVRELGRGWTPERAEELRLKDVAEAERGKTEQPGGWVPENERMRHYLYFPEKSAAEQAAQWFRSQKFAVEVRLGADGKNWLALVKQAPPKAQEMDSVRAEMEVLAAKLGGEYDGWEVATDPSERDFKEPPTGGHA